MFLGTLFELMATGYVLAIVSPTSHVHVFMTTSLTFAQMSRYFTLVKQRRASSTEQIAVSVACLIAV
jgi:hypothetical protein